MSFAIVDPVMDMNLRIRDLREDADLTKRRWRTICTATNPSTQSMSGAKRMLPLDLAIELAKFYHVSLDYLVGLKKER